MKKCHGVLITLLFGAIFLLSCAGPQVQPGFQPKDLNPDMGRLSQKVNTFLVIFDASSSMSESFEGKNKLTLAKEIVEGMNQTIPDIELVGGFRTFGHSYCPFSQTTTLVYGMTPYSKEGLRQAVNSIAWASGKSPLAKAIGEATEDLKPAQGNMAVIVVSDADDMDDAPVSAAEAMKAAYGPRVCIYTILIGNDPGGKQLLEKIAQAGECGFSVSADMIASSDGMADFVTQVFLGGVRDADGDGVYDDKDQCPDTPRGVKVDSKGCPLDSDGDGVADYRDRCPDTPKVAKVDEHGCPLDSDGDGVYDYQDECPNTPKGAKVNEKGCWVLGAGDLQKGNVLFDTGKSDLKPEAYPVLNDAAAILKRDSGLRVEIQGHTDSVGSATHNQTLSQNRANAVRDYLVNQGIDGQRLTAKGYGFSRPAASNDTAEGRALNRRVELMPLP